jgi:hypothetical protein
MSWNGQYPDIVWICYVMKWSSPRHSISLFCHEMVEPQTYNQSVLSWNGQAPDIVSVCFVMKWSSPRHSISLFCHEIVKPQTYYQSVLSWNGQAWGLTISWQNRLILCLRLHHFMTKQTDTISGASSFHDKTDWYYIWGLTIMKRSSLRHSISLLCHEMVNPQT